MSIIERILASKAGLDRVVCGQEISVSVDLAVAHDVTAPLAIEQFESIKAKRVYDNKKIAFVMDHNIPCSSVDSRKQHKKVKQFSMKHKLRFYGKSEGVIHQVIAEENLYKKGDIIVGADSHTCTEEHREQ